MLQPRDPGKKGGKALIALGSNVTSQHGDPAETLEKALEALAMEPVEILAKSRLYRTPCFPPGAGPDYVNAVVLVETALSPEALLVRLHAVEAAFDRQREARWASRSLDLDLLTMDQKIRPDQTTLRHWVDLSLPEQRVQAPDGLVLPHPRMQDRAFVLVPAAEIAPDWRHPLTGASIAEMLAALDPADVAEVVAFEA